MTTLEELSNHLNYKLISGGVIESNSRIPFERVCYAIPQEEEQLHNGVRDVYLEDPDLLKSTITKVLLSLIEQRQKNAERLDESAAALFTMQNELKRVTCKLVTDESESNKMKAKMSELQRAIKQVQTEHDSVTKENRQLKTELAKSKAQILQVKDKMMHEIRRRDQETLRLKNRLYDPRKARLVPGMVTSNPNWKTTVSCSNILPTTVKVEDIANKVVQQDIDDCYTRCQEAINENTQLWDLLLSVSDRLVNVRQLMINIPGINYKQEIDDEYYSLLSLSQTCPLFSQGSRTIIEDQLNGLENLIQRSSFVPTEVLKLRDSEIGKLKEQLAAVTTNWKQAISTMQMWSNYNSQKSAQNDTDGNQSNHDDGSQSQISDIAEKNLSANIEDKEKEDEAKYETGMRNSTNGSPAINNEELLIDGLKAGPLQEIILNEYEEEQPLSYGNNHKGFNSPPNDNVNDNSLLDAENLSPVKLPVGHGAKRRMTSTRIPRLKRIRLECSESLIQADNDDEP